MIFFPQIFYILNLNRGIVINTKHQDHFTLVAPINFRYFAARLWNHNDIIRSESLNRCFD